VDFFLNNWILVAIALISGFFLVLPVLQGAAGAGISPAEAVQLMNRDKAVVVDVCPRICQRPRQRCGACGFG
jgi:hypothetical protein